MPFNGSLSFCLRHQSLERDLEDQERFLQSFFLCTKHEDGINRRYRMYSIGLRPEILFAARKCFAIDAICRVNVQ